MSQIKSRAGQRPVVARGLCCWWTTHTVHATHVAHICRDQLDLLRALAEQCVFAGFWSVACVN